MKKFLALVLALLMVFSCFTVVTFAEDTEKEEVHSVSLTGVEVNTAVGSWGGGFGFDWELEGHEGKSCLLFRKEAGEEVNTNGGMLFHFNADESYDITGMKYINFMFYTNMPDLLADRTLQFELTSSGKCDVEESSFNKTYGDLVAGGLQEGWNQAQVPLSAFGGSCNMSSWNFLRIYNRDADGGYTVPEGETDLIVAIDDFYFSNDEGETIEISKCEYETTGWTLVNVEPTKNLYSYAETDVEKENKLHTLAYVSEMKGSLGAASGAFLASFNYADTISDEDLEEGILSSIDISEMKFLTMDLYVSDAAAMGDIQVCLELTSSGTSDSEEIQLSRTLNELARFQLKDGWNTVSIPLAQAGSEAMFDSKTGEFDATMVDFFRIFNLSAVEAGEGMTFAIDNIAFNDGTYVAVEGEAHETITYADFSNESAYATFKDAGWHGAGFSFSDAAGSVVLQFPMTHTSESMIDVRLLAKTGSQLALSVSMDGENFTDVLNTNGGYMPISYYGFNLTDYVDFSVSDVIYVKFADSTTEDGNGGRLYNDLPIVLDLTYEEAVDGGNVHYDVVSSCDTAAGWSGLEIDKTNQNEGKGCLTKTFEAGKEFTGGAGAYMFTFRSANTKNKTHDASNMAAFCFDLYVSDVEMAKTLPVCFEMTSSGTWDKEESQMSGTLDEIWGTYVDGGLKEGWNSVVIPMSAFPQGCDWTKWNFTRIFNHNGVTFEREWTIKLDNFRFWDGDDGRVDETCSFALFSDDEAIYLDPQNHGSDDSKSAGCRFNDCELKTIYEFTVENIYNTKAVTFTAGIGGQYVLEVSQDGKTWTTLEKFEDAECETQADKCPAEAVKSFDLTPYVDLWESQKIYIRMGDSYPAGGWGGKFTTASNISLTVTYVPASSDEKDKAETTDTEHRISLLSCNEAYAGATLDKKLGLFGSGCVKWYYDAAGVKAPGTTFDAKDCTGMDTLEFWVYLSDAAVQTGVSGGQFELTSGKTCDVKELTWNFSDIFNYVVDGSLKIGEWNHIALPLSSANADNGFEINNVNFTRWYTSIETVDANMFIAFDNFYMSDRQAQAKEAAKPEAQPVIEAIAALDAETRVTADNYETAKAAYEAAAAAYKALSSNAKAVAQDDASYKNLAALKKLIGTYESALEVADQIKALKDLDVTGTADNDKTVEKARKAYDKLKDDADLVPADVLAILTEKEAAIETRGEITATPTAEPTAEPTGDATGTPAPTDAPAEGGNTVIIIIIVAVVVVAAAGVCLWLFVFKKKD